MTYQKNRSTFFWIVSLIHGTLQELLVVRTCLKSKSSFPSNGPHPSSTKVLIERYQLGKNFRTITFSSKSIRGCLHREKLQEVGELRAQALDVQALSGAKQLIIFLRLLFNTTEF